MDNELWMSYGLVQEDLDLSELYFPLWYYDFEMLEDNIFGAPLMQQDGFYSKYFCQDPLQDEFATLLDDSIAYWDDMVMEASMINEEDMRLTQQITKEEKATSNKRARDERELTYMQVSQYFNMPIIQAAKELNIGLTQLKKRCRELDIPRWPHRTIKSLQALIEKMKESGEEGSGDLQVKIKKLEQELKLIQMWPSVQMQEDTKKLRQAYFKANYKRRRLEAVQDSCNY